MIKHFLGPEEQFLVFFLVYGPRFFPAQFQYLRQDQLLEVLFVHLHWELNKVNGITSEVVQDLFYVLGLNIIGYYFSVISIVFILTLLCVFGS